MKKRVQTLLCLLLTSVLTASFFVGCESSNAPATGSAPAAGVGTPDKPTELFIYTYALGQATTPSNDADLKMVSEYIASQIGIYPRLVMAPTGTETEKLNLLLASNEQIDIFKGTWTTYQPKKAIISVNDVLEKYGQDVKKAWPQEAWDAMTDKDGKIWGVAGGSPTTPYPVFVREDWLKDAGLKAPTTFDELENVLKVFKEKDYAGNGTTIPMITALRGIRFNLSAGYTGKGYGNWLDPSDNKIKPMELNPDYKDFIARMADWYKNGYIFKESFSGNVVRDMIKQNKVGVHAEWYSNVTFSEPILQLNVPSAHYEIYSIAGPNGKTSESPGKGGPSGTLITSKCKNPEAAMKYINWGYEQIENFIIMKDGLEGVHWQWANKELKITEPIDASKITYYGELAYVPLGIAIEKNLLTDLPEQKIHYDYLKTKALDFDRTIKQDDFDVFYDANKLKEDFPNVSDITKMIDEQTIAFITGTRPMSQYDAFIKELYDAGLSKWIDAYTAQYNALSKK